jgi:hypothetical protein
MSQRRSSDGRGRSRRAVEPTERHLYRAGKLEQGGDREADYATTDARRDEGRGAIRPRQR